MGVLRQMYKGGYRYLGGYETPGFTVPGTWYLVPQSCFMCIFLCIITHIPAFLRLIRVDFSTKKGVQNQPSMQPGRFFLCCTILYFLVIKYGKIPSRYFTIRSRTILEAYRKIQPGLIFTSNTMVPVPGTRYQVPGSSMTRQQHRSNCGKN